MTDLVDHQLLRAAIHAFSAEPSAETSIEVLRQCLVDNLLFDITGSDVRLEDGRIAEGSEMRIAGSTGPDGKDALLAFTRQEEIGRMHEPGSEVLSIGQPAVDVLTYAKDQGIAWLYLDPAGPTCALSAEEIEFAVGMPHNTELKRLIVALDAGTVSREDVVAALRADGPLLLAAGEPAPDGGVPLRGTTLPDGTPGLAVYTSAPEVAARSREDRIISLTTTEVLGLLRDEGYGGIVVDPAGPWAAFPLAELGV